MPDLDYLLKLMEIDRKKMIAKLQKITDIKSFEYQDLLRQIKAHDAEVGKLLGIKP